MIKAPLRLVWVLVAVVLAVAGWRLMTLRESRSPDQQKLIEKTSAH